MRITKKTVFAAVCIVWLSGCIAHSRVKDEAGLSDALNDKFKIGVAMNNRQIAGYDTQGLDLISKHFNSIVAENCMKSEIVQPAEDRFDFDMADKFVAFGQRNKMFIVGHTLIWHSQSPGWFFRDEQGNTVSREVLIERMRKYITTVVKRYKGKVQGWDVVNEAINDDGSFRENPFYTIIGKDYIRLAFQFAHAADPKAELYYNDYSMAEPRRRETVVKMVKELQNQGVKIDAVGMQGHLTMNYPTVEEFEKSIVAYSSLGVKVMITEMDITVLPFPGSELSADVALKYKYDPVMNPYSNGLPDSVNTALHNRYAAFFRLFLKYSKDISRVTVWGLTDNDSWRNNWPVEGRVDYPLLFDRNYIPKPIVATILEEARK